MSISITAKSSSQVHYSITQSISNQRVISDSETTIVSSNYSYGTGNLQINTIAKATGVLSSGDSTILDLNSVSVDNFGVTYNVSFDKVKSILVSNTETSKGADISIKATGTYPFTDIFNGGSGNLLIKPYSSFIYNDPFDGITITPSGNNRLEIFDIGGSGASYSVTILGIS